MVCISPSVKAPANREKRSEVDLLLQLPLDLGDELGPLLVDLVLRAKQRPALLIAKRLEALDLLLPGQLVFQSQGCSRRPSRLLDLPIDLLDLSLQTHLEVVGPAVELVRFQLEEACIPLRDVTLDQALLLADRGVQPRDR